MHVDQPIFNLPDRLAHKASPALIADDERFFTTLRAELARTVDVHRERLERARRAPGGIGQAALDRDQEIHRLTARLALLQRYGIDLCLGRIETTTGQRTYIGRMGLADSMGTRLLVDWRSPAAEPFFSATYARPAGLASRRRYRWTLEAITDFWDELFNLEDASTNAALDDESAFIASLGASRSAQMRDVLGTIQADQDAIIRASSRGALVVEGGPGTGKTVVALHRAAFLLHSDPRLGEHRGGILVVGPHRPYLTYVDDVLPSLGEDSVRTCTLLDLVPEGAAATNADTPEAERLKSTTSLVQAIEAAVTFWEDKPSDGTAIDVGDSELWLSPDDWSIAFDSVESGTPHNEAHEQILTALADVLVDKYEGAESAAQIHASVAHSKEIADRLNTSWTLIDPPDLVSDLWSVPAYLQRCAPWLTPAEVQALRRADAQAWTPSDVPLLDAARERLGDRSSSDQKRRQESAQAAEREQFDRAIHELAQADGDEYGEGLVSMLRHEDLMSQLVDDVPTGTHDALVGPFAHIIVDEAQELTDAQWQMLLARCPSRSFTIVGDRAQARHGFTETWTERLARIGLNDVTIASLKVNYRTPVEVMSEASPTIREAIPDAIVPMSVRSTGIPVLHGSRDELVPLLHRWLDDHPDGVACVIGDVEFEVPPRTRALTPELSKGLEFDLVIVIDPATFGEGIEGAVDRYVAMTRATQQLIILT